MLLKILIFLKVNGINMNLRISIYDGE